MKQKSVGLTLRATILALALILVAGFPALPPFDGVAYAQDAEVTDLTWAALPDGSSLTLDWTEVVGADSYRLWKGEGRGQSVAWGEEVHMTFDAPTVSYVDTAVTAGMTYSYVIEVYEGDTRLGWSDVENVTMPGDGTQKPTAQPTVTLAADGLTAITVTWTEVSGAANYRVRYWTSGLKGWMDLATAETGRTLTHPNLTPGRQYYYIVRGQNAGGNGPYSGSVGNYDSYTLMATDTVPTLTSTHVSRQVVQLSWTATSATATYSLERRKSLLADSSDGTWETLSLSAADQSSRTHTDNNATYDAATAADGATRYHYRVQAVEGGTPGQYSNVEVETIPASGVRPTPPTNLAAAAGSDAVSVVRLTWTATSGTTSEIRWMTSTRAWSDPVAASSPYDHTGRSPSTEYTYQVRAVNVNGPSLWSAEVSQSTAAAPATGGQMPKVMGLTVMDESSLDADDANAFVPKIKLEWDQVTSATHYDIRRFPSGIANAAEWGAPGAGNDLTAAGRIAVDDLESPTSPSWEDEDTDLDPATTYYYVVSAVDDNDTDGELADDEMGEWSAYDSTTTIALTVGTAAPAGLGTTVTGPTSIWLSWTAVDNATSYTIQWRIGNGSYRTISDVTGTTHHHQGLTANTEYLYRVRAENANSMTPYSDPEISETTWRSGLQPPSNFTAEDATTGNEAGGTQAFIIEVSWTEAAGAAGYQLQRWNPGSSPPAWEDQSAITPGTGTTTDTSVDDGDRTAGTTYYYRVRTVTATDMSAWSPTKSATTDPTRPTAAPTLETTSTGMSMIRISWTGESGATMYTLEAVEGIADAASDFATPVLSRDFTENVRHFVHTGLTPGTRYSYRIKSVLTDEVESPFTEDSSIASEYTKPRKPELTASAVDYQSIRLSWNPVPFVTAEDPTVAGYLTAAGNYRIERRATGTNTWTALDLSGGGIGACTGDEMMPCSVVDDGEAGTPLTASTRYFYRIRAIGPITSPDAAYTSYWDYASNYTQADPNN